MAVLIVVQVKDYVKKLVTAMIWFTSRMKLDPNKERWDLSLVVKSFVLLDKNNVFLTCAHYIKPLSGFEHSVCQLQAFYILACVAGVFLVRILFLVRIYAAVRRQKRKRWGEMVRRRKRVFLTTLLASPFNPPPFHHFLVRPRFWLSHSCISYFTNHKRRNTNTKNHQGSCSKGAAG